MRVNGVEVWTSNGLPITGQNGGPVVVAACAPGPGKSPSNPAWRGEFHAALGLAGTDVPVIAVNRFAWYMPMYVKYWVSCHPEVFYTPESRLKCPQAKTISDKVAHGVDLFFAIATSGGSSALLATMVALVMGYDRVLLAGVHLDYDRYDTMRDRWIYFKDALHGRVKALGGWPMRYFGHPDKQWMETKCQV